MDRLQSLLWDPSSVAHIVFLHAFVMAAGAYLGKMKILGVSLGVTFVLSVGILMGRFGFTADTYILHFIRKFGLILSVFCVGLQVGPSLFSSLKKGGMTLNLLAVGTIVLNIAVALGLHYLWDGHAELSMTVGVLYGVVIDTPRLGAASEALNQLSYNEPQTALGCARAYSLGIIGTIGSIIAICYIFRTNTTKEEENLKIQSGDAHHKPHTMSLEVHNESTSRKTLIGIKEFLGHNFACPHIRHEGHVGIPNHEMMSNMGDQLFIICSEEDVPAITIFIGKEVELDQGKQDLSMVSRRILVTKPEINGKTLGSMYFRSMYSVDVARVNRSDMDLFADPNLILQVGGHIMVVGQQDAVERVAGVLGNQLKRLDTPNIVTTFVGISLGTLLGSLPVALSGISTPLRLDLVGGSLVVAILIRHLGHELHLVTYTTIGINLMSRKISTVLFLASVGIDTGVSFVQTVVKGDGLLYVGYGFLITVIPLLIIGATAKLYYKVNYFILIGLIVGSNTDPPALAYVNRVISSDTPAVGYSVIYSLSMFLRILTGQMILLAIA